MPQHTETCSEEKAKLFEKTSYALKYTALGIKKIPTFANKSPGIKLLAAVSNGLSQFHKGEQANIAATMAAIDLGCSTFFIYRTARLAPPLLKAVGLDKTAIFLKSTLDGFNRLLATILVNPDNIPLCDFMDQKMELLANRSQAVSISDEFVNIVRSSAEKHGWSTSVEDRFSILFSSYVAKHLSHDETTGFHITPPETQPTTIEPTTIDESALIDLIANNYNHVMAEFESTLPELYAEHFTSPTMINNLRQGVELTEEQLVQLTEATAAKINETVRHSPQGNALQRASDRDNWQVNLREISSMMQDGALIAMILHKPAIAQSFSSCGTGIERFTVGFEKLHKTPSFLSKLSGAVTLFSGIGGLVSGIISFFTDQPDPMEQLSKQIENLGKQMEYLGKQMDCVLQNQRAMGEILFLNSKRLQEIDDQLKRFAKSTGQQLNFIAKQDLIQSTHNINLYLTEASAIPLNQEDLRRCLITLQTWLTASQHLCSTNMNGGILNETKAASSKDAVAILSTFNDWESSTNMVGFILKQLQHMGIDIPVEYFDLPPLELYTKTLATYYYGLNKLERTGCNGQAISKQLQNTYQQFSNLIRFLENNHRLWTSLYLMYQHYLGQIKRIILDDTFINAISQKNIHDHLSQQPNSDTKNESLSCALDKLEEVRLLLSILNEWTNQPFICISKLPSKEDILSLKKSDIDDFVSENFHHKYALEDTDDHQMLSSAANGAVLPLSFDDPFVCNPTLSTMQSWFDNRHYEPLILHIAAALGEKYVFPYEKNFWGVFPDSFNHTMMAGAKTERYEAYKNGAVATDFMVIISLFVSDHLRAVRMAYQYYTACYKNDEATAKNLRSSVNPKILLWLVAMLGRYDIFQTIAISNTFDFTARIGYEYVGTFHRNSSALDDLYYTTSLNPPSRKMNAPFWFEDKQRLIATCRYEPYPIPVMIAAKGNRIDVINGLLNEFRTNKKDIGLFTKDSLGKTAAHIAFDNGHFQLAKLLDDYSHTLSTAEQEELDRKLLPQFAYNHGHYPLAKLLDDHSHTLSTAKRIELERHLATVTVTNDTTTHQEVLEVLANGTQFAEAIAKIGQFSVARTLTTARVTEACTHPSQGTRHDEGEHTDSEDEAFLHDTTQAFFAANHTAYSPSLWKKPANAKPGIRELGRAALSGKSVQLVHQLRASRGENSVKITQDTITLNLLTRREP